MLLWEVVASLTRWSDEVPHLSSYLSDIVFEDGFPTAVLAESPHSQDPADQTQVPGWACNTPLIPFHNTLDSSISLIQLLHNVTIMVLIFTQHTVFGYISANIIVASVSSGILY